MFEGRGGEFGNGGGMPRPECWGGVGVARVARLNGVGGRRRKRGTVRIRVARVSSQFSTHRGIPDSSSPNALMSNLGEMV